MDIFVTGGGTLLGYVFAEITIEAIASVALYQTMVLFSRRSDIGLSILTV